MRDALWQLVDDPERAYDRFFPLVYEELRRIASNHLRRESGRITLCTTALVHESYLRLCDGNAASPRDRAHFFALASRVMRHVLVDHARKKGAAKRGGDWVAVSLAPSVASQEPRTLDLIALDQVLGRLGERDPRMEQVVNCKVFGGMTSKETANALGVSTRTVEKDWKLARAFLHRELDASAARED